MALHPGDREAHRRPVRPVHQHLAADGDLLEAGEDRGATVGVHVPGEHRRSGRARCRAAGEPAGDGEVVRWLQCARGIHPQPDQWSGQADRGNGEACRPRHRAGQGHAAGRGHAAVPGAGRPAGEDEARGHQGDHAQQSAQPRPRRWPWTGAPLPGHAAGHRPGQDRAAGSRPRPWRGSRSRRWTTRPRTAATATASATRTGPAPPAAPPAPSPPRRPAPRPGSRRPARSARSPRRPGRRGPARCTPSPPRAPPGAAPGTRRGHRR